MIVDFTVQGEPFGKQRPRLSTVNGFSMAYTPQKTAVKEAIVRGEYERQCGNAYFPEGAVSVMLLFSLSIPASASKRRRQMMLDGFIHPTKKPDIDNATKLILDSLNGVAWKDDKQVCVIGDYINRTAFGGNGVGKTIKLGPYKFRIVGVLNAKISDPTMQQGNDDDCIYLPYTTAMRLSQKSTADSYICIMVDENQANEAKAAMENGLYNLFKSDDAYYVYSASEWLEEMNKMINMVIVILTGIASISLLVGGIGIMNIMLVSVTERTKEIGIRKAMGAKERVILAQFVTEAATTSALGGALGIVLGYIVSMAANRVLPMFTDGMDITVSPSFDSIVVAFGISAGIGVLFGYLPAKRAAKLNPIDALRYD